MRPKDTRGKKTRRDTRDGAQRLINRLDCRRKRRRALIGLNTSMEDWIHCLRELFMQQRNKKNPFLSWATLGKTSESCEGINTTIRKLWRFLDPHASRHAHAPPPRAASACVRPFASDSARDPAHRLHAVRPVAAGS